MIMTSFKLNCYKRSCAHWPPSWVVCVGLALNASAAVGQGPIVVETFEFASSDSAAAAGVIDITDPANRPSFYISGAAENASQQEPGGLFSIGTDAVYCLNFQVPCDPGTFIGFYLPVDPSRFANTCPGGGAFAALENTYGDPLQPGAVVRDFDLSALEVRWDVYGDGGFADGLTGTHLWLRLLDCEGEKFEFVNYSETSLYSEIFTLDVLQGEGMVRIAPESLTDVPAGDRLLTEIAAIEVLIQDADDPPTTLGKWYVDYLRVSEPLTGVAGDADNDGDVDTNDYAVLAGCDLGPNTVAPGGCARLDLNGDADIDLFDFALFQLLVPSGPQ